MNQTLITSLIMFSRSVIAILPALVTVIAVVIAIMLILYAYKKAVIVNHFHDNIDEKAKTEITILEAENKYLEQEVKRLKIVNQEYKSARSRTIEIWGKI